MFLPSVCNIQGPSQRLSQRPSMRAVVNISYQYFVLFHALIWTQYALNLALSA